MKREEIYTKLKEIIVATFKGDVVLDNIDEQTNLTDELGVNSIIGIEILVRVENEFEIEIDDEDLTVELTQTMATLADYIERKLTL